MAAVTPAPAQIVNDVTMSNEQCMHTPPASDMSSRGRKGEDDEADSTSELSDLDDQFEGAAQPSFVQDAPTEDAPTAVEPDRYEGGIPVFQPTMAQFQDFEKYMTGVNAYGMKTGIVLIDPPQEWKAERKALDEMVKTIKVRNPITQEFHHNEYGIYTQRNMEKMRTYNLPQWKALCEQSQYQPPARRGERRTKVGAQAGGKVVPLKRKSEPLPLPEGVKRKAGRPRVKPLKEEKTEEDNSPLAPPTPTSPKTGSAMPVKHEEVETADLTPNKRRGRPAKGGVQSKPGRQSKATTSKTTNKSAGDKATTVAARRLHNEADGPADDINDEDFQGFDYRTHNHDEWTKGRCEELEEKYWKSLSYTNPMYGADMPGSLFDDDTKCWNVAKLPNLLDILGSKIPGVNTAYLYLGMWRATFAWHLEDVDLYSINYIHFGAPKQWYSISQEDAPKFEKAMRSIYANEAKNCDQFLRHKTFLVSPSLLKNKYGVSVNRIVHREGQFVVTFPIGYHSGYNLGYNCAESVNFALESWLPYGKTSKKCRCEDDSVFIDVDWFIRRLNGEPTPEVEEWVEVTDDEDDMDGPTDLPTPPGSDRGLSKPAKRKRQSTKDGGGKRLKRIKIKICKAAVPCCLCPNDFACDDLLPTEDSQRAHRRCALYTPETYIDEVDGKELIRGMGEISKARLDLRCNECRQKRGSCFQCSSAKCARAYHATCAAQAGVQVDIGDVAIWHEGTEYRDTGLDFRCKMHRSVKTAKPSSDLARDNYRHIEKDTKEFHAYLTGLKPNDIVQYQLSSADDIEAGVLVEELDEEEGVLVLDLLPTRQRRYIEANTVLYVDAATSCLQKPSINAKEIPLHLRGKALSLEDATNRKPSRLDHFCNGPDQSKSYRWEEFTSVTPALNKDQKVVDLSKDLRIWYYLGQPSTESKAQYTGDPLKPVYDPASSFLQSVEPAKRPLITQGQPSRRLSLPASYPAQYSGGFSLAAANAATVAPHVNEAGKSEQQKVDEYQRRMAVLGSPATAASPLQYYSNHNRNQASLFSFADQRDQVPQLPTNSAARDDFLARQKAILDRSQHRAMALDQQDRPYAYTPKSSMPPPNIGIDTQSVDRQRDFQRRAYQQSMGHSQLSPHSPTIQTGFSTDGPTPWGQHFGPDKGTGYATPQISLNTARYGNASPSPTEAAFPLLRRSNPQPISSSQPGSHNHHFAFQTQSISSLQPQESVGLPHNQSSLSPLPFLQPQALSQHPPSSPSPPPPPPLHLINMSSSGNTPPIDMPHPRSNMSSRMLRDRGQHTPNFIDPNLMQLSPNLQTLTAPPQMTVDNEQAEMDQATRAMGPPPLPSLFSHSTVHPATTATEHEKKYTEFDRNTRDLTARDTADLEKGARLFNQSLDYLSTETRLNKNDGTAQKTLVNDKPIPKSIAMMPHMSATHQSRPNVYATPYQVPVAGATAKDVTTKQYKSVLGKITEEDSEDDVDDDGWVQVKDVEDASKASSALESGWVAVEIDRTKPPVGAFNGRATARRGVAGAGAGAGAGLANDYYGGRSCQEKELIDAEMEKMGWYTGEK